MTDPTPFLTIAAEHYGELRAYAHQLTRDYDAAEDALQHCLLAAAEAWPDDRPLTDDDVRRYLGRSIKNKLRPSRQRKKPPTLDVSRLPAWEQPVAPMEPVTSPEARQQAERDRDDANLDLLRDTILSLDTLPRHQAESMRLHLAGYTTRQIAELLNITQSRAQRGIVAARRVLQERFGERYAALQQEAAEAGDTDLDPGF